MYSVQCTYMYLQILYGAGREGLVVPAAVAEGGSNGFCGPWVTLAQSQHTLGEGGREREGGIGRREGEKWREGRGEEEEGETTFLSTHLVDESLAVVDGEQGLVHGVQRRSKVSVAAWNAIRVLCSLRPFPSL